MSKKNKYDNLIKQSIGNKHMLEGYLYYDKYYFEELKKQIKNQLEKSLNAKISEDELYRLYSLEFHKFSNERIKICAAASSSRLGFIYGINNGLTAFEKTDIVNGICKPHYDGYKERKDSNDITIAKEFYEFKCHEFTDPSSSHSCITKGVNEYERLIKKHFGNNYSGNGCSDLFKAFGLERYDYFDLKQLVCHLLGLLSIEHKSAHVSLEYIIFIPSNALLSLPENQDIKDWLNELNIKIKMIFDKFNSMLVMNCNNITGRLDEFVKLKFEFIDVSDVNDCIYKNI